MGLLYLDRSYSLINVPVSIYLADETAETSTPDNWRPAATRIGSSALGVFAYALMLYLLLWKPSLGLRSNGAQGRFEAENFDENQDESIDRAIEGCMVGLRGAAFILS